MPLFLKLKENNNKNMNLYIEKLVSKNCLYLGQNKKFTKQNKNLFILGDRFHTEIFKTKNIYYNILRLLPLIKSLYLSNNNNIIKILFATTTNKYSNIVSENAISCDMPYNIGRWLCGTITTKTNLMNNNFKWSVNNSFAYKKISNIFQKKFQKIPDEINMFHKQYSKKPSLLILPDPQNNPMILKEAYTLGIPTIGLINTNSEAYVDYPIFGNDESIYVISFFCELISSLILKEKEFFELKHNFTNSKKKLIFDKKSLSNKEEKKEIKDEILGNIFQQMLHSYFFPNKNAKSVIIQHLDIFKKIQIDNFKTFDLVFFKDRFNFRNNFIKNKIIKKNYLNKNNYIKIYHILGKSDIDKAYNFWEQPKFWTKKKNVWIRNPWYFKRNETLKFLPKYVYRQLRKKKKKFFINNKHQFFKKKRKIDKDFILYCLTKPYEDWSLYFRKIFGRQLKRHGWRWWKSFWRNPKAKPLLMFSLGTYYFNNKFKTLQFKKKQLIRLFMLILNKDNSANIKLYSQLSETFIKYAEKRIFYEKNSKMEEKCFEYSKKKEWKI